MKLNKIYQFQLETTQLANKLKKLLITKLDSTETRKVYYMSRGSEFKKEKKVTFLLLDKVEGGGYITYFCNGVYGLGEFYFITEHELEIISVTWNPKLNNEEYNPSAWRMLTFKDSIIAEFEHPVKKFIEQMKQYEREEEQAKENLARAKKDLEKLNKRIK